MRRIVILLGALLSMGAFAASAQAVVLNVWGTSDISDSGLLANVIVPGFKSWETAQHISPLDTIKYTAVGSGAAITEAENPANGVDAILVHSPSLELPFVNGGYSYEPLGRSFFYNDYVIVGPTNDPAGVLAHDPNNAVGAFEAIAAQGAAHHNVTFISRADNSGTNVKEQQIWGQASSTLHPGVGTVVTQEAFNGGTDTTRAEPATSATGPLVYPDWYKHNSTSNPPNQGANLIDTNTCNKTAYPDGGCYTIVDRGTWDNEKKLGNTGNLEIVSQNNSASAPGGQSELTNPFHAYIVKSSTNITAATHLLNYLVSTTFQNAILPLSPDFIQSAYAAIANSTLPTSEPGPTTFSFHAQLLYTPPVPVPIVGMPVNLQSSSSQSGPWTTIATATSDSTGTVTFNNISISATTYYRFDMGTYDDFDANVRSQLSPNDNANLNSAPIRGEVTVG